MRKIMIVIGVLFAVLSCKNQKDLQEQLKETVSGHLGKIDSSAILDSVHILWQFPITDKAGRIMEDSIYMYRFARVQSQLVSAQQQHLKDSIEFYQYEINYMKTAIDSVSRSIVSGDTVKKYGTLIGLAYSVTKNGKTKTDSTIITLDAVSRMRYTEYLDSAIERTVRRFN